MKENKNEEQDIGQAWLFFGCRHRDADFLFKDDLTSMSDNDNGPLTRLVTVFSRDDCGGGGDNEMRYVQHAILKEADSFARLLRQPGAVLCVCGDAANMAREVDEAVAKALVQTYGNYLNVLTAKIVLDNTYHLYYIYRNILGGCQKGVGRYGHAEEILERCMDVSRVIFADSIPVIVMLVNVIVCLLYVIMINVP